MIYLITVHDRKKRLSNIDSKKQLSTNFWKSVLKLTEHKTILYPIELFNAFDKKQIPNRVNILFSYFNKKVKDVKNILINNNFKDIIMTFGEKSEDLYVIGATRVLVERFSKDADYIIDYTSEEMGFTNQIIFDSINFADYTLLNKKECEHFDIRYFVREKTNFIGY